ncbi:MAG: undecaprenyl-diphosphate phosphatase [Rickettsiales bacterium]|jgi:undecaprenyl-diphosphatase|nr:undecaprenyl-diphosphate phosphatase [Rickettsiales bacterium]
MTYVKLLILLFFNTVIEFLPVSSTAHSILLRKMLQLNFNLDLILAFSQLAISLSLCFYFRTKIIDLVRSMFFETKKCTIFCMKIVLTMLPTLVFGFFFYRVIKNYLYTEKTIALCLIIGAIFMLILEKVCKSGIIENFHEIDYKLALKIGLFQCLSLIPGISRSASTIGAGLFYGLKRGTAVDFSFFISIPLSISACIFDIYKNASYIGKDNAGVIFYCFCLSLFFSLLFMGKIINVVKTNKLSIFAYYRIVVGTILGHL